MSNVIQNSSVDDLLQLTPKERLDTLIIMSIEILDSLTPIQLECITFDWLRAYHATMYNLNYVEIKNINGMAPQLRRRALHDIILARDDRSFDRLDQLSVQPLLAIFNDRKANAGDASIPISAFDNEFSVPHGFFVQEKQSWGEQADALHADLERFNLASDNCSSNSADNNTRPRRWSVKATSDPGTLVLNLRNLRLENRGASSARGGAQIRHGRK